MSIDDDFFDVATAIIGDKAAEEAFTRITENYAEYENNYEDVITVINKLKNVKDILNKLKLGK